MLAIMDGVSSLPSNKSLLVLSFSTELLEHIYSGAVVHDGSDAEAEDAYGAVPSWCCVI